MKKATLHFSLLSFAALVLLVSPQSVLGQQHPLPEEPKASPTPKTKFFKSQRPIPHHYIVVLSDDVAPDSLSQEERRERVKAIADEHAKKYDGKVVYIYETALRGYSIQLKEEASAIAISKLAIVKRVEEDSRLEPFE